MAVTKTVKSCDVCQRPVLLVCYDARIGGGGWGNMCPSCFVDLGCRLGVGLGQRYERKSLDTVFTKTAG